MKRTPLERRTGLSRGGPVGSKKSKAAKARALAKKVEDWRRKYGSLERVFVVSRMRCVGCGTSRRRCDNAHGRALGLGLKAGYLTVNPLCRGCHTRDPRSYHELGGQEAFDREVLIPSTGHTWDEWAEKTEAFVQEHGDRIIQLAKMSGQWDEYLAGLPGWLRELAAHARYHWRGENGAQRGLAL